MRSLNINGAEHSVDAPDDMPLLWAIRDVVGLTGTKFGCGIGQCGACTVLIDGEAARSCSMPIGAVEGKKVVTIEGLDAHGRSALQQAWIDEQVPQCGYCQSGQIMAAAALLKQTPHPTQAEIETITNICRCGTYLRIRSAILRAAGSS
jgi:isoquinoline 1-oxidoreductase subunit alpha